MKNNPLLCFLFIVVFFAFSCQRKPRAGLPDALFDTLKNQVLFIPDSSSKQTAEYSVDISRVCFLDPLHYSDSKDSFIVRLFIDPYRKKEKQIIEIKCGRNNCAANRISFDETFDGENYSRSKEKIEALQPPDDWRSFFDTLIMNDLLVLPNGYNSFNCANNTKDGITYAIQSINFSGQKHCSDYNTEVYDTTCIEGKHFNNIVNMLKALQNNQ